MLSEDENEAMNDVMCTSAACSIQGWIGAFVACLSYGSYGVPIKHTVKDIPDLHPFIMQTYKTCVLFCTCWFVLLFKDTKLGFTNWGIVSGFLWVLGGSGGVYAIQNAGMATAVGTWSSTMVMVNFVWGILIFHEPVHSIEGAIGAFICLGLGLVGMSYYSSPSASSASAAATHSFRSKTTVHDKTIEVELSELSTNSNIINDVNNINNNIDEVEDEEHVSLIQLPTALNRTTTQEEELEYKGDKEDKRNNNLLPRLTPLLTKRQVGMTYAVFNGLFAGSSLVPIHFAKAEGFGGKSYIISFGVGSFLANGILWVFFFLYYYCSSATTTTIEIPASPISGKATTMTTTTTVTGSRKLPSWHFEKLWKRGIYAGLLLSIGMYGSIIATSNLGQGVGNSLVQSKILVSGLWGIFYFKEIKEPKVIRKWFLSSSLCVLSILWLSYERLMASEPSSLTGNNMVMIEMKDTPPSVSSSNSH